MNTDIAQFEAKVRAEWIDEATSAAWRKWHDKSVRFWHELTREMLAAAQLEPGQRVLDLASGTGDPALTIAERVGAAGHVVMSDLSPQMLEIARDNAARLGMNNVSFMVLDAHQLPIADATFDRVTCRLGVMYFWDCKRALGEIHRVLKPGGIASFIAWGPVEQNEYMRAALGPFKKRQPPPAPPPGAPQPYRFGEPGSLSAELRAAGFPTVHEVSRTVRTTWPGPPEELWTRLYEVSAPMRPYFNSFTPEVRAEATKEAIDGFASYFDGREVTTRTAIVVAAATK
jgi:SAM-dependent methyltransferase